MAISFLFLSLRHRGPGDHHAQLLDLPGVHHQGDQPAGNVRAQVSLTLYFWLISTTPKIEELIRGCRPGLHGGRGGYAGPGRGVGEGGPAPRPPDGQHRAQR